MDFFSFANPDLCPPTYPFPKPVRDDKSQQVITNELRELRTLLFLQLYILHVMKLIGSQLDGRFKIISDARSAIATRTEFGVPEIGDGTTLASIILNPLTPFTLENVNIVLLQLLHLSHKTSCVVNVAVVYLNSSSTTASSSALILHVPPGWWLVSPAILMTHSE